MSRYILFTIFAIALCQPAQGQAEGLLLQRDWMIGMVDALGLSYGLPDEPRDGDYLTILSGNRHLRIEAEEHFQPNDPVSVQSFLSFGPYSGQGWLSGGAGKTTAHLRFLLPLTGHYQLAAVLRRGGFVFEVGGRSIPADGESIFTRVLLGSVTLEAGEQEIVVHFPPNGALDHIELKASSSAAISPPQGWQPDLPLNTETMATTMVQALALYDLLPHSGEAIALEAEALTSQNGVEITDITHLGQPSGGRWLRAGSGETVLELVFQPPTAAVFDLGLRGAAQLAVPASLNGRDLAPITFPPYLGTWQLGTFYLPEQQHRLTLRLPPRSGVDVLYLQQRRSRPEDFLRLVGLPQPSPPAQTTLMDDLLALLAVLARPR